MNQDLQQAVEAKYAAVAESSLSSGHAGVHAVAEAFGYTAEQLAAIPSGANMGLSCGNPTALASLQPGEVVVDLGCGGGLDVFLAAQKVGPRGRVHGIDRTPAMIERARRNAAEGNYSNVEFHLATIDRLPLPDASVDCVLSNCVINLAPDKPAVFREVVRVLKPGGRLAVSDIALKQELPMAVANSLAAYVGCIAGALSMQDYRRLLLEAGFAAVEVVDSGADLNAYSKVENQAGCCSPQRTPETVAAKPAEETPGTSNAGCCQAGPAPDVTTLHTQLGELLREYDVNQAAASVRVYAIKPANNA